jgi:hypothetical protein
VITLVAYTNCATTDRIGFLEEIGGL